MARGKWNTSFRDRARAQYQADQIAEALAGKLQSPTNHSAPADELNEAYRRGWIEGRNALLAEMRGQIFIRTEPI
jgi:hypothetical protein